MRPFPQVHRASNKLMATVCGEEEQTDRRAVSESPRWCRSAGPSDPSAAPFHQPLVCGNLSESRSSVSLHATRRSQIFHQDRGSRSFESSQEHWADLCRDATQDSDPCLVIGSCYKNFVEVGIR